MSRLRLPNAATYCAALTLVLPDLYSALGRDPREVQNVGVLIVTAQGFRRQAWRWRGPLWA